MKHLYKILIIVLLVPLVAFKIDKGKKHKKSKNIHKSFIVSNDATVNIKNKYGNVNIITWDENKVEIDVKITVKGDNLEKVEEKLNNINVNFDSSSSLVKAVTVIEKSKSNWFSWFSINSSNVNYQINYLIKMPITNLANINNSYGNIDINELKGKAIINCDYGKITAGKLMNTNNKINLDYCSKSLIRQMNGGNVSIDYSNLTIEKSTDIDLNADYSDLKFESIKNLKFNNDYGNVSIGEAETINGDSDYTSIKINTLKKRLKLDVQYGGLKIKNIADTFKSINVNADYTNIKIGTAKTTSFKFLVDLSYGTFRYPKDYLEIAKRNKNGANKHYEGTFGNNSNTNSTVKIDANYGGFSIIINE